MKLSLITLTVLLAFVVMPTQGLFFGFLRDLFGGGRQPASEPARSLFCGRGCVQSNSCGSEPKCVPRNNPRACRGCDNCFFASGNMLVCDLDPMNTRRRRP